MGLEQPAHIDRHPSPLDRPRRPHPDPDGDELPLQINQACTATLLALPKHIRLTVHIGKLPKVLLGCFEPVFKTS